MHGVNQLVDNNRVFENKIRAPNRNERNLGRSNSVGSQCLLPVNVRY